MVTQTLVSDGWSGILLQVKEYREAKRSSLRNNAKKHLRNNAKVLEIMQKNAKNANAK